MNLEDHIGDILKKARLMAGVEIPKAADAAGISEAAFSEVERSGQVVHQINWGTLASTLALNGEKLTKIANGWHPASIDLSIWRELRQISNTAEGITVNCYLVWDEVSREAALFDTGWQSDPILQIVEENGLQLRHLFITHNHEDHIAALSKLREAFPKLLLHKNSKTAPPQHRNRANDFIHLGSLRITNRETPGHSEDSVTYIVGTWPDDAPHVAIVGDAIFAASMGTGNQSWELARQKVKEQILSLPPATLICPGHGPLTTVADEKENNPFF
jgi:hydroxyacylglutathione hydrolase